MAVTMLPPPNQRPDVLPTDRLLVSGKPVPAIRAGLRRIPNVRNGLTVVVLYAELVALCAVGVWLHNPFAWVGVFLVMGSMHARFAILGHEAAHRLLFSSKRANDVVGRWLLDYPAFVPFDLYRRAHFAHHKQEFGPHEPDLKLYNGYPITKASMRRKLVRDGRGSTGWKSLKSLLKALFSKGGRPIALRIFAAQLVLLLVCTVAGYPLLYLLWLGSWLTVWRVINRLRSIAEHGGMTASPDRRLTTHHVHQHWIARFWMVPYNTGWHLAHHVDMGVPWRKLPALHRELVAAGWVVPDLEYPNYLALWRKLASRPAEAAAVSAPSSPSGSSATAESSTSI